MPLTHRERVETSLAHETPDRCPMQISFTPEFARSLLVHLNLSSGLQAHNPHGGGNTYLLERHLEQDLLLCSVGWANSYYQDLTPGVSYTDEWGVGWRAVEYKTPFGNGVYTEMVDHPLEDDDAIEQYRAPDPCREELYREARQLVRNFRKDYWIVGVTVTTIFETAWALRGYERILTDFMIHPERLEKLLDIPFQYHLEVAKNLVRIGVDMIWTGDDIGTQEGMLMDPDLWRRHLKPRMARFISELKSINPDVKVAYHSDGNIYAVIPDLVEIGLDVLNPIQPACLDHRRLKHEFGNHLSFWGSIDEQKTLPFGTTQDVTREVRERIRTIGRNGGFIVGPTHHVQLDTPMDNFWAMHRAILETPSAG
jgi:uroporphyrinogen decarboxylase